MIIENTEKVKKYLKRYSLDRSKSGEYARIAEKYGVNPEAVRSMYRRMRAKGIVEPENHNPTIFKSRKSQHNVLNHWNDAKKKEYEDFIVEPEDSDAPIPVEHDVLGEKILYFSDQHFVHHNKEILTTILNEGKKEDVQTIVLGGDIIDFYQISRFSKRPDKSKLIKEVEGTRSFLGGLRKMFPDATIYSLTGNHEARLLAYICGSASALFDLEELQLDNLLKYKDNGIIGLADKQILKVGKLNILHGHEVKLFPMGINTAKSMLDKVGVNVLFGHFHRTSSWMHTDINGETIGSWAVGCSSDLHPDYNTYGNNWNHGFAVVTTNSDGTFSVRNKIIDSNLNIY